MEPKPDTPEAPLRGDTRFAAQYVHSSTSRLEKLRCFGGGPPFYKLGRRVIYDRSDLDAWLRMQKRRSTSDTGPSTTAQVK